MVVRYNQRWEEMEKSGTPLEKLFESYALFKPLLRLCPKSTRPQPLASLPNKAHEPEGPQGQGIRWRPLGFV